METRGKRKQAEAEAAEIAEFEAPVRTRAQKAARLSGQATSNIPSSSQNPTKEQPAKQPAARGRAGRAQGLGHPSQDTGGINAEEPHEASKVLLDRPQRVKEEPDLPSQLAEIKAEAREEMDRQRKEGRRGAPSAGRDEQVRVLASVFYANRESLPTRDLHSVMLGTQEGMSDGQELFGRNLNNASR